MKLLLYSLYNNKLESYGQIMSAQIEEVLLCDLSDFLLSDEQINPVDYELFKIGEFDTNSGKADILEAPKHIKNLITLKSSERKEEN